MKCIDEAASEIFRLSDSVIYCGPLLFAIVVAHNSVVDLSEYQFMADILADMPAIIDAFKRDTDAIPGVNSWIVDPVAKVLEDLHSAVIYAAAYGE